MIAEENNKASSSGDKDKQAVEEKAQNDKFHHFKK